MEVVGESYAPTRRDSRRWPGERVVRTVLRWGRCRAQAKGAGGGSSPPRDIHSSHTSKVKHPVPAQDPRTLPSQSSLSTWGNMVPDEHASRVVWGVKKINGTAL